MTDHELRTLLAETAKLTAANSVQINQLSKEVQQLGFEVKQLGNEVTHTGRQVKQLGKQLGDLGNKFGRFTEGLFFPSLVRILALRFGIETTAPRVRRRDPATNQVIMELNGFGYSNSNENVAVIVEVKTELHDEDVQSLLDKLRRFPEAFPEHRSKKLYGIIAATILPENLRAKALKHGLFVASISDEAFRLTAEPSTPRDFSIAV